jgi:hypothetical protein
MHFLIDTGLRCPSAVRQTPIEEALIARETALNLYIVLFLSFGALFGVTTYSYQHIFSEGPYKVDPAEGGSTLGTRVLWAMVCTFLWPIMILTGLNSAWILAKRKRRAAVANH